MSDRHFLNPPAGTPDIQAAGAHMAPVYHLHSVLSDAPSESMNTLMFTSAPAPAQDLGGRSADGGIAQAYHVEIEQPFAATRDMLESLHETDVDRLPSARPEHYIGALLAYAVQNGHDGLVFPQGLAVQGTSSAVVIPAYPGQIYPVAAGPAAAQPAAPARRPR